MFRNPFSKKKVVFKNDIIIIEKFKGKESVYHILYKGDKENITRMDKRQEKYFSNKENLMAFVKKENIQGVIV